MARRRLTLELDPVLAGARAEPGDDAAETAILDAAEALVRRHGLHRWSVEDVADLAAVGRTSVYRRFPSRDDLVHGVLARELRSATLAVGLAVASRPDLLDGVVEAVLAALAALEGSVVDALLQSDPGTVLPLLTTGAGPLVAQAREAFAPGLLALGLATTTAQAAVQAEVLARLGLSFVLTRPTALPLGDAAALRAALRDALAPLLRR